MITNYTNQNELYELKDNYKFIYKSTLNIKCMRRILLYLFFIVIAVTVKAQEVGPTGPTGPQSVIWLESGCAPTGITGFIGPTGATGEQGIQGTTGASGVTGPVAGSDMQIQFNDGGNAAGAVSYLWNKSTGGVVIGTTSSDYTNSYTFSDMGSLYVGNGITDNGAVTLNGSTSDLNVGGNLTVTGTNNLSLYAVLNYAIPYGTSLVQIENLPAAQYYHVIISASTLTTTNDYLWLQMGSTTSGSTTFVTSSAYHYATQMSMGTNLLYVGINTIAANSFQLTYGYGGTSVGQTIFDDILFYSSGIVISHGFSIINNGNYPNVQLSEGACSGGSPPFNSLQFYWNTGNFSGGSIVIYALN
jgi:hypothetical protein